MYFKKIFDSKKSKVWITDQNGKPLEVEDKINLTLAIK